MAGLALPEAVGEGEPEEAGQRRQIGEERTHQQLVGPRQQDGRRKVSDEGQGQAEGQEEVQRAAENLQRVVAELAEEDAVEQVEQVADVEQAEGGRDDQQRDPSPSSAAKR
jgi:hypothetical protein